MKIQSVIRSKQMKYLDYVFFILGFIVIGVTSSRSIGVSVDSVKYFSIADNFWRGHGFQVSLTSFYCDNDIFPRTAWPPGYPCILSIRHLIGLTSISWARWVAMVGTGVLLLLIHRLSRLVIGQSIYSILPSLIAINQIYIVREASRALTELPFMICLVSTLIFLVRFIENKTYKNLIGIAVFAGFSSMFRYTGLYVIIFSLGIIWIYGCFRGIVKKTLIFTSLYFPIAVLPLFVWSMRNMVIEGAPFGKRSPGYAFDYLIALSFNSVIDWLPHRWMHKYCHGKSIINFFAEKSLLCMEMLLGVILFVTLTVAFKKLISDKRNNKNVLIILIMILFGFGYFLFIIISTHKAKIALGMDRMLVVVFPVFAVIFAWFLNVPQKILNKGKTKGMVVNVCWLLFAYIFIAMVGMNIILINKYRINGKDLTGTRYASESIVNWLENTIEFENYTVYSNLPELIYLHLEKPAHYLPRNNPKELDTKKIEEQLSDTPAIFVIFEGFNHGKRRGYPEIEILREKINLVKLFQSEQGSIWIMNSFNWQI